MCIYSERCNLNPSTRDLKVTKRENFTSRLFYHFSFEFEIAWQMFFKPRPKVKIVIGCIWAHI
jgi:hypothetical protein